MFVVLSLPDRPNLVLMGKLNPSAPWEHLGALDRERTEANSKLWTLPSSHLILFESPQEAAYRILTEQLSVFEQKLTGPYVFNEVYGQKNHWDIEFIFMGERESTPSSDAWTKLEFVDQTLVGSEAVGRMHQDILAHVKKWNGQGRQL